jgi:hypothetical protein
VESANDERLTWKDWFLFGLVMAVLIPVAFGFAFAFMGGWTFLPPPWSSAVAVLVYGTAALLGTAIAVWNRRHR